MNKRLKDRVFEIMSNDEATRNNDKWLYLEIWKEEGVPENIIKWFREKFPRWTDPATIKRVRAEIQNNDKILLPTLPYILIQRKIAEEDIRNYYRNTKPDLIEAWQELRFGIE